MSDFKYPVFVVYSKEDECYLGKVDQLPGCVAHGDTPEEAVKAAMESADLWVEAAKKLEREIPHSLSNEDLVALNALKASQLNKEIYKRAKKLVNSALQEATRQEELKAAHKEALENPSVTSGVLQPSG